MAKVDHNKIKIYDLFSALSFSLNEQSEAILLGLRVSLSTRSAREI